MHNIDGDVRTTESEERVSEAGGGGSIEVATGHARSRSDDGASSAPISAIVPQGILGSFRVTRRLAVDFYANASVQGHKGGGRSLTGSASEGNPDDPTSSEVNLVATLPRRG